MTPVEHDYVRLIRATTADRPVLAMLQLLAVGSVAWSAVITPSGRPIISAQRDGSGEVERDILVANFASLPSPLSREYQGRGASGIELMALPIRAEARPLAVLLLALDEPADKAVSAHATSAALLMRMHWRYRRRMQVASRMVRDSVARLMFAGKLDSAFELASEMGLATPPTRPHVACICGLAGWDTDDILDRLENTLPPSARQLLAYTDDDECWLLLSPAQFQALRPELESLIVHETGLRLLLTEQVPASRMSHRWQHWASNVRATPPGQIHDRSAHQGDSPSDMVAKLRATSPGVLDSVVSYLRHRGRWEAAAEELDIHRNTLRYRVATAERTLNADLTNPTISAQVWLALVKEGLASA